MSGRQRDTTIEQPASAGRPSRTAIPGYRSTGCRYYVWTGWRRLMERSTQSTKYTPRIDRRSSITTDTELRLSTGSLQPATCTECCEANLGFYETAKTRNWRRIEHKRVEAELSVGLFSSTQPNSTHQINDPTQPHCQVNLWTHDPTQLIPIRTSIHRTTTGLP